MKDISSDNRRSSSETKIRGRNGFPAGTVRPAESSSRHGKKGKKNLHTSPEICTSRGVLPASSGESARPEGANANLSAGTQAKAPETGQKIRRRPGNRTVFFNIRLTPDEKRIVERAAAECGLKCAGYARKVLLGYRPKYHLTERENNVYEYVRDFLAEIRWLTNVLSAKSPADRVKCFRDYSHMKRWVNTVEDASGKLLELMAVLDS